MTSMLKPCKDCEKEDSSQQNPIPTVHRRTVLGLEGKQTGVERNFPGSDQDESLTQDKTTPPLFFRSTCVSSFHMSVVPKKLGLRYTDTGQEYVNGVLKKELKLRKNRFSL